MAYPIIDTADNTTSQLPALKRAATKGIIRYDDPSGNASSWKQIWMPEVRAILGAGFSLGIVSEWGNNHDSYFSAARGAADALWSMHQADVRQQPASSAVFFAVDYDVESPAMNGRILPFFQAIKKTVKDRFRIGCYGSGYCCDTLLQRGLIELRWITCSSGFNGSRASIAAGRYELHQEACDQTLYGLSVDGNVAHGPDWGQWGQGALPDVHDSFWMQSELNKAGAKPPLVVDGIVGDATINAMVKFIERAENIA